MPSSMWVAWFSPRVRRSRMTAHDASFESVDSMPYFLKSPSSCAITIDEQSVRAMMPILTFGVSGPSAAYTPPAQPVGSPAKRAAAPVETPSPVLKAGHFELSLPRKHRDRSADPAETAGDLTSRIDPGELADHAHIVDAHARFHLVMDREDGPQLLGDPRLRQRSGS